jgi:glycosyltransferase involved in cell wall biosynthesis
MIALRIRHNSGFDRMVIHGGRGIIAQACEEMGVPHVRLPLDSIRKLILGFPLLVLALRRARPDVLFMHGQWAGPVGALAARLAGIRKLVYVARWPSFYTDWDLYRLIRNFIAERIPCRIADRVVVLCSSSYYQYFQRHLVSEQKLRVIPNPIDLEHLPSAAAAASVRQLHRWSSDHVNVVSVGRISTQKRLDWLLKSWAIVQRERPGARLWIVGDGELRDQSTALAASLGIDPTCTFLGPRDNGWDYIAAADVVAMTTMYESRGNIVLEAMAAGKPIVASDVDGVRDSISHGVEGLLVRPGDIQRFADSLIALIDHPNLRSQLGRHGSHRVRDFNLRTIMRQYDELVDELLAESQAEAASS